MNIRCFAVVLLCLLVMAPTVGAQSLSYLSVASAFITQSTTPTATPTVPPPLITREYVIDPQGNGDFTTIPAFITGTAGLAGSGYKVVGHLVPGVHMTGVSSDVRLRRNQYLRGSSRDAAVVILYGGPTGYRFILTGGSGLENLTWVRVPAVYLCLQEDSSESDYPQVATVHRVTFKTVRSFYGDAAESPPAWGSNPYVFGFGKDSDPDCDGMTLYIRDSSFEGNSIFLMNGGTSESSPNGTTKVIMENCDISMILTNDDLSDPAYLPQGPIQSWRGGDITIRQSTITTDVTDFSSTFTPASCIWAIAGSGYSASVEIDYHLYNSTLIHRPYESGSKTNGFAYIEQNRTSGNPSRAFAQLDGVQLVVDGDEQYMDWDVYLSDNSSSYDEDLLAMVTCHDTDTGEVIRSGNNAVFQQASVIEVDINGSKDFTKIQEAIDSIQDNGIGNPYVVLVYPGVYELGPDDLISLKPYVTLKGISRDEVTISPDQDANWGSISMPAPLVEISGATDDFVANASIEDICFLLDNYYEDGWQYDGEAITVENAKNSSVRNCFIRSNWHPSFISAECIMKDRGDASADDEQYRRSLIRIIDNGSILLEELTIQTFNDSTMLAIEGDSMVFLLRSYLSGHSTPYYWYSTTGLANCLRQGYRGSAVVVDSGNDYGSLLMYNSILSGFGNGRGLYIKSAADYTRVDLIDTTIRGFCIDVFNETNNIVESFVEQGSSLVTWYGALCRKDLWSNNLTTERCLAAYMTPAAPTPPPWPTAGGDCTPIPTPTMTPTQ